MESKGSSRDVLLEQFCSEELSKDRKSQYPQNYVLMIGDVWLMVRRKMLIINSFLLKSGHSEV